MMSLLTRLRIYVKSLFTRDQKLCFVNNTLAGPDATSWEEACVVSSTPDEQPAKPEQQSVETQPQPAPRKKYVAEKDVVYESFKNLTPEYMFIISEMRNLLDSETKKFVFYALSTHISIKMVAKHLNITRRKVKSIFQEALTDIGFHTGFVKKYLDESAKKKEEIRILKSKIISLNDRIKKLQEDQVLRIKFSGEKISINNQRLLLNRPLAVSLNLDTRTYNALRGSDVDTLEDLMRFVLENKSLEKLKTLHNFGETSFKKLTKELIKKGIIDINGHCELLQYVTVPGK